MSSLTLAAASYPFDIPSGSELLVERPRDAKEASKPAGNNNLQESENRV